MNSSMRKRKLIMICYANYAFYGSQQTLLKTARHFNDFDEYRAYSPKHIDADFRKQNENILKSPRGGGLWLWKPYLIQKTLQQMQEGDILCYFDAGCRLIKSCKPLIEICINNPDPVICFDLSHLEKCWTKRDLLTALDCDYPKYTETKQRLGGYSLWRKSKKADDFVAEWLHLAKNEHFISDSSSTQANYDCFQEHRHDQSIFSLLTKKYNFAAFRDPSQFGYEQEMLDKYTNSPYAQIIESTRWRNSKKAYYLLGVKTFLCRISPRINSWFDRRQQKRKNRA